MIKYERHLLELSLFATISQAQPGNFASPAIMMKSTQNHDILNRQLCAPYTQAAAA
jgi:hypothetical protein